MSTISLNHYLECTLQVFVFHTTQREETHKRLSIPPNGKLEAVPFTIRHQCGAAERNLFKERHFRKRAKEGRRGRKELGEGRSSIEASVFSDLKTLGVVRTQGAFRFTHTFHAASWEQSTLKFVYPDEFIILDPCLTETRESRSSSTTLASSSSIHLSPGHSQTAVNTQRNKQMTV